MNDAPERSKFPVPADSSALASEIASTLDGYFSDGAAVLIPHDGGTQKIALIDRTEGGLWLITITPVEWSEAIA